MVTFIKWKRCSNSLGIRQEFTFNILFLLNNMWSMTFLFIYVLHLFSYEIIIFILCTPWYVRRIAAQYQTSILCQIVNSTAALAYVSCMLLAYNQLKGNLFCSETRLRQM